MDAAVHSYPFARAARRVAGRLFAASWLRAIERTAVPVFVTVFALWVIARRSGGYEENWWALGIVVLWIVSTGLFAWFRRTVPFAALAMWDRATGNHEMLASAWFFEQSRSDEPGAALHLARAREYLEAREHQLSRDLPLRHQPWVWLLPVAFVVFVFSGWLKIPLSPENTGLTLSARERAGEVGKTLTERAEILDRLKALSEEEQEKLKGLRAELKKTAQTLHENQTPRDLLEKLERGARDTERLAEALGEDDLASLSSSFLSELEKNADTADLGNALRAKDLGRSAEEARLLEARLGKRKPTLEEQKRLEEALKRALEAANKKDRNSKLGKHLAEAQRQLSKGNHQGAAGQFGALGGHYGRSAQRQQTQQQLRGLAQSFRGAGQHILGGQNLQRLMPSAPLGSQPLAGIPQLAPGSGNPGQQPLNLLPLPVPGNRGPTLQIPIPGSRSGSAQNGRAFPVPGSGQQRGGMTMPIPGTGQNPGGMPGGGMAFPIPGAGAPIAGGVVPGAGPASPGGSQAGNGTAPLSPDPIKPLAANQTGVVAPVPGAEGPSEVRAVAGEAHREQASRSRQELAVEFLETEEAALADEPLPLSRREEVLRYFTAIRQHLEHQP